MESRLWPTAASSFALATMNIISHPLLAGAEGYGEAMNRLHFGIACIVAIIALLLSLLPERWRALRWVSLGFALIGISLAVYLSLPSVNSPLWQPVWVMMLPVLVSLVAIALSSRTLIKK